MSVNGSSSFEIARTVSLFWWLQNLTNATNDKEDELLDLDDWVLTLI